MICHSSRQRIFLFKKMQIWLYLPCHCWFNLIILKTPVTFRTKQIPSTKPYFLWKKRPQWNGSQALLAWNGQTFCGDAHGIISNTCNGFTSITIDRIHNYLYRWCHDNIFNPVNYEKYDRDRNLQQNSFLCL